MKQLLLFICSFIGAECFAQIVMERQVVSCMSLNMCDNYCIYSTAGQSGFHTYSSSENIITAGFEQPNGPMSMSANIEVTHHLCDDTYEVTVVNLSECSADDTVFFYWNGVSGGMVQSGLPALTNLSIHSTYGCHYHANFDFETMEVIEVPCLLDFFTYFSPNGDGDNDFWVIGNIDQEMFAENEVVIFNRWGGVVWQAKSYNNGSTAWYGTNEGDEILPDGTYFYVVKVDGKEHSGYVELMR